MEQGGEEEVAELGTAASRSTLGRAEHGSPEVPGALTPVEGSSTCCPLEGASGELGGSHTVPCMLMVSLAVPVPATKEKQKSASPPDGQGEGVQADESKAAQKTQSYYHMECFLLPDDLVPQQLDLVVFGTVAKLFTGSNSKTLAPWIENDQMWISWNHSTDVNVTNEFLIKLRDHKMTLKLWDSKDKVSPEAKNSKPTAVSSLEGDAEATDGVKHTVLLQRKLYEESQPAPSCTKIREAKESKAQKESSALPVEEEIDRSGLGTSGCGVPRPSGTDDLPMMRFEDKAQLLKQKAVSVPSGNTVSEKTEKTPNNVGILTYLADKRAASRGRRESRAEKDVDAKRCIAASLQLDLMPLLSGEKSVISRVEGISPAVLDAYVSFTVETPLLSERQRHELNPLIIKIYSATRLPNTPVPIQVLQGLCLPVYCKYKFHNFPPHQTHGQIHGTHVYFKDVGVFLTGTMKPGELQRYLRGPPLEIEVHDRDRKMEDNRGKPCLFGEDQADEKMGEVSLRACKPTIYNSPTENGAWHPHGVAKVDLTDLLLGKKCLTIRAPIHGCSTPNTAALNKEDKNEKIAESVVAASRLPMGHYLQSDSLLKVRVEIAVPLNIDAEIADVPVTDGPYGCIIYIFDYNNWSLLHDLVEEITEINSEALQLACSPAHLIRVALAALKPKTTLGKVSELDIVTGFHLLDGVTHLFVLEGLKDKAIKRLWDRHFERAYRHEDGQLKVLYNSQLSFSQRLYTDLEAIFYHFCLNKPLFTLVKLPLLYVRGTVPWACFQALSRLSSLCHSQTLRDVIHGDLLPSAEMITVLSQQCGASLTAEDLFTQKPPLLSFSSDDYTLPGRISREKKAACSSSDCYNEKYVQWKKAIDRMSFERNYVKANIDAVRHPKGKTRKPKFQTFRIFPADGKSVYNYSCQSLNSAELAKKYLSMEMAKEPKTRFTYCHEYLSATFDPTDVVAARKKSFTKSKCVWLSPDGFKSSTESSLRPRTPDEARVEELSEKWQESTPCADMKLLPSRDRWSWDKQHVGFGLHRKPPARSVAAAPLAAAELRTRGPGASSQLQNLQGLVKDKPRQFSVREPGLILKPMPALSVLASEPSQHISDVLPEKKRL